MPPAPTEPPPELLLPERLERVREVLEFDPAQALVLLRDFLASSDPREGAHATLLSASAHYKQGQSGAVLAAAELALKQLHDLGDPLGELGACTLLGRIARDTGHFETASAHFGHALVLARRSHSSREELDVLNLLREQGLFERQGTVLSNMGTLHTLLGDYPQALEHLKEAYTLLQGYAPGSRSEATNLLNLGSLYQEMGSKSEALHFFTRARELGRSVQDPLIEAAALNNMANSSLELGDYEAAQALFSEALTLARKVGVQLYEIDNLDGLGQVHIARGDILEAARRHREALEIARAIGDPEGEIDALLNLGRDALKLDEPQQALKLLQESLALAQQLGRQPSVFAAHELLAEAFQSLGDLGEALKHYRAFHDTEKRVFNGETSGAHGSSARSSSSSAPATTPRRSACAAKSWRSPATRPRLRSRSEPGNSRRRNLKLSRASPSPPNTAMTTPASTPNA